MKWIIVLGISLLCVGCGCNTSICGDYSQVAVTPIVKPVVYTPPCVTPAVRPVGCTAPCAAPVVRPVGCASPCGEYRRRISAPVGLGCGYRDSLDVTMSSIDYY